MLAVPITLMNTSCLYSDTDWLVYSDYLDDQNINHFIREDVVDVNTPWTYERRLTRNGCCICSRVGPCLSSVGGNNIFISAGSSHINGTNVGAFGFVGG
jgi:hypothetical protein